MNLWKGKGEVVVSVTEVKPKRLRGTLHDVREQGVVCDGSAITWHGGWGRGRGSELSQRWGL